MKQYQNKQAGIAHVVLVVIIAVVLAAIGFAAWRVMQTKDKQGSSNNISSATKKQAAAECTKEMNDKTLCKFFTNWDGTKKFAVTSTDTADGKTTRSTIKIDNGNTYLRTEGDISMEMITIGTTTYTKAGNTWWRQATKPPTSTDTTPTVNTNEYKFDEPTTTNTPDQTQYKNLGKEACGNFQCYKYQVIDPASKDTAAEYIWFDDSQYLVRKMRTENKDGSVSEQAFSYDNVSVTAPSPAKDLAPNQYIVPGESEPTTLPSLSDLTQ